MSEELKPEETKIEEATIEEATIEEAKIDEAETKEAETKEADIKEVVSEETKAEDIKSEDAEAEETEISEVKTNDVEDNHAEASDKKGNPLPIIVIVISILAIIGSIIFYLINARVNPTDATKEWYSDEVDEDIEIDEITSFENLDMSDSSISDSWVYGTSYDDVVNDDNYWYISNPSDNNYLYRVAKKDYSNELLVSAEVNSVNVVGDIIYFSIDNLSQDLGFGIYSMNMNTGKMETLIDDPASQMQVVNDWVYYKSGYNDNLYKLNINNRMRVELYEDIWTYKVRGNDIYIAYYDEVDEKTDIIKIDVDGKNKKIIVEDIKMNYLTWLEDSIAYGVHEEFIATIDYKTGDDSTIVYASVASSVSYADGKYYYISSENNREILIYDENTRVTKYIYRDYVSSFSIMDDLILINYVDGEDNKVSVNKLSDGTAVDFFN